MYNRPVVTIADENFGTIVAERGVEYRIMVSVFIRKQQNFVDKGFWCLSVTSARRVSA